MTELLFIRHGLTDWNLELRFQGQTDVPLNAAGQAQAQRLAARLAAERHDALFSSDLLRARQTAAPVAEAWRQSAVALAGLREQHFGILEGLTASTIQQRHPELWARWLEADADFAPTGGESQNQFHARVLGAVRELAAQGSGKRLAVVTHGGVLDMLWRTAHGLPLTGLARMPDPQHRPEPPALGRWCIACRPMGRRRAPGRLSLSASGWRAP